MLHRVNRKIHFIQGVEHAHAKDDGKRQYDVHPVIWFLVPDCT